VPLTFTKCNVLPSPKKHSKNVCLSEPFLQTLFLQSLRQSSHPPISLPTHSLPHKAITMYPNFNHCKAFSFFFFLYFHKNGGVFHFSSLPLRPHSLSKRRGCELSYPKFSPCLTAQKRKENSEPHTICCYIHFFLD
jgi:hypothetical protein